MIIKDISGNIIEYHHLEQGLYTVPITVEKEDLNGDGKVNIEDVSVMAKAFGSYGPNFLYPGSPAHPRWDPRSDIDGDNQITVIDEVLIAMKFHD